MTDKEMMLNPTAWPGWPYLAVKRDKNNYLECGFMIAVKGYETTVFLMNIWDFCTQKERPKFEDIPHANYKNIDELMADGWIVD